MCSTRAPASRAASTQGVTFASWSSRETITSSPGSPGAAQGSAQAKRERGHVRPERDRLRVITSDEIGQCRVRFVEQCVARSTGGKHAAMVGVDGCQILAYCVGDALRNLAAGWTVQVDRQLAIDRPR